MSYDLRGAARRSLAWAGRLTRFAANVGTGFAATCAYTIAGGQQDNGLAAPYYAAGLAGATAAAHALRALSAADNSGADNSNDEQHGGGRNQLMKSRSRCRVVLTATAAVAAWSALGYLATKGVAVPNAFSSFVSGYLVGFGTGGFSDPSATLDRAEPHPPIIVAPSERRSRPASRLSSHGLLGSGDPQSRRSPT